MHGQPSPGGHHLRRTLAGVGLMAMGMVLIPLGDAIAKHLGTVTPYSAVFLSWSRFVVGAVLLIPVAWYCGMLTGLSKRFYLQQAVRGAMLAAAISLIIKGVQNAPLADSYGAYFVGPTLATLMAAWLLKERVTAIEWCAVILGFVGVLLVVKPTGTIHVGIFWALVAGGFYGAFLVATRWSSGNGSALAQLCGQLFFGLLFLAPFAVGDLFEHGVQQTGLLITKGIISAAANLFAIMALARAGAVCLAPVVYLQIISAAVLSAGWFGDSLDFMAALGLGIIVLAGLTRIPWRAADR